MSPVAHGAPDQLYGRENTPRVARHAPDDGVREERTEAFEAVIAGLVMNG